MLYERQPFMYLENTVKMSIKSVMLQSHTASDGSPFSPGTGKAKPFEPPRYIPSLSTHHCFIAFHIVQLVHPLMQNYIFMLIRLTCIPIL